MARLSRHGSTSFSVSSKEFYVWSGVVGRRFRNANHAITLTAAPINL
jgi:hypothetical protein